MTRNTIVTRYNMTRRTRSITYELSVSPSACASLCLSCQKSKYIEESKISERLSVFFVVELKKICQMYYDRVYLCEGQKWDLEREVRKRDYEVQEKWKAATTANNARRKRATVKSHVSFDHFSPPPSPPTPAYQTTRASPYLSLSLSLLTLSLVFRPPPFCTYVSLTAVIVLSFTMFFLAENTCGANADSLRGVIQWEKFPRWKCVEEPSTRIFCHLPDLCNLDQSCLDMI